jgi:hypothetical protein
VRRKSDRTDDVVRAGDVSIPTMQCEVDGEELLLGLPRFNKMAKKNVVKFF